MNSRQLYENCIIHKYRMSPVKLILLSSLILIQVSCNKLVEVKAPVTSVTTSQVYNSDASSISVITTLYQTMMKAFGSNFTGKSSLSLFTGMSADELTLYSGVTALNYIAYYENALASDNSVNYGTEFWSPLYNDIYVCNAAIEGLEGSTGLTPTVKKQLLGEAKFMRAFFYFYLTNMYGNIPLSTSSDWAVNSLLSNAPKTQIYQQLVNDLKDAQSLLSQDYLGSNLINTTSDRIRPTKWAATGLLARTYLFNGDYVNAEAQASVLINNSTLFSLDTLNGVFLKNSHEAIWQLQPTWPGDNTEDAVTFIIPSSGPSDINLYGGNPVYLSNNLLTSFEVGDLRRRRWVDSVRVGAITYYYPYKYKIAYNNLVTEYLMVMRLAEQYLIRAEARAQQNNLNAAISDLNTIRSRAGLPNLSSSLNQNQVLDAILHEKQIEFFTEWGHRWFDLKRRGKIDAVMGTPVGACAAKGGAWQSYKQFYPVPFGDIQKDPNLSQTAGY